MVFLKLIEYEGYIYIYIYGLVYQQVTHCFKKSEII